jgi:hydroxyacylglutathione hydrolase
MVGPGRWTVGSQMVNFDRGAPVGGDLAVRWGHGSPRRGRGGDPPVEVHPADPHTYVLRQSMAVHREAPFMYLFCGNERALLLDTGATADPARFPLRSTVEGILDRWLGANPRSGYELVVAHTHAHYDHVAGDGQFTGRAHTRVVGHDVASVARFFSFADWPGQVVRFDLGGRILEITGCPGHHRSSIAVYDPWSGWLVTGDTVYPGRLYVEDFPAFLDSLTRLVDFAGRRPVTRVMGCHVEMTSVPGRDYPMGCSYQPDEAELPMSVAQLQAVHDAARSVSDRPGAHFFDDFAIFHGRCTGAVARQLARAFLGELRRFSTRPTPARPAR